MLSYGWHCWGCLHILYQLYGTLLQYKCLAKLMIVCVCKMLVFGEICDALTEVGGPTAKINIQSQLLCCFIIGMHECIFPSRWVWGNAPSDKFLQPLIDHFWWLLRLPLQVAQKTYNMRYILPTPLCYTNIMRPIIARSTDTLVWLQP